MAFAGIFQPFARLRWIRFGLLMRDRKFSRCFSVPQTTALTLALRPRLRVTRSEIAIHEFGRHRHHDQSKNPAHHTTGSKLAPQRAVLKFNLDAIHGPVMQTMAHRRTISVDVRFLTRHGAPGFDSVHQHEPSIFAHASAFRARKSIQAMVILALFLRSALCCRRGAL